MASMPSAAIAALCIAGESECATGSPATARILVDESEGAAFAARALFALAPGTRVLSAHDPLDHARQQPFELLVRGAVIVEVAAVGIGDLRMVRVAPGVAAEQP